ncbi:replication initiator [Actinosynnema sp. NPDC020468]|uniref:replication initiator n=1 Tax=Actinosynnema sp. NPDC020468 TaxID=3154488 RepID=UPI0033EFC389
MSEGTRVERMRQPVALEVAKAAAEKYGVCVRPFTMEVEDRASFEVRYVAVPCGSTVESVCKPCARKAKALRMAHCREGWHMTEEPDFTPAPPSEAQTELLTFRADLVKAYREAVDAGEAGHAEELREEVHSVDAELRQLGVRGRFPTPDLPERPSVKRSTKRRQDSPDLPRRRVEKRTVGREFAGGYRPSMFVTLTLDTYGRVRDDGTPVDAASYDYRRAARDAVHFASLIDRWWQNLRRVVGWDVQYFATVEPQRRAAPHLHAALRGSIPHDTIRLVTAATYHQVWWPAHDELRYPADHVPVWDPDTRQFVDPDTRKPLPTWADAVDQVDEPAHVVRFGRQVHSKGILGGSQEAGRHIGYLTKYLTKSIGEVVEPDTDRKRLHADRLADELAVTPCSDRCPVWLRYGVQPRAAGPRTVPGHCKGRAHRRTTLGLPGRRVLVSRKWSGKTLADHRADRKRFVLDALKAVGIDKPEPDTSQLTWNKVRPGDPNVPPRAHQLMHAIAERTRWKAEYDRALLAAHGAPPDVSAIPDAA